MLLRVKDADVLKELKKMFQTHTYTRKIYVDLRVISLIHMIEIGERKKKKHKP